VFVFLSQAFCLTPLRTVSLGFAIPFLGFSSFLDTSLKTVFLAVPLAFFLLSLFQSLLPFVFFSFFVFPLFLLQVASGLLHELRGCFVVVHPLSELELVMVIHLVAISIGGGGGEGEAIPILLIGQPFDSPDALVLHREFRSARIVLVRELDIVVLTLEAAFKEVRADV